MLNALLLSIVIAAETSPGASDTPAANVSPCRTAHILVKTQLDSSTATAGETFTFTVSDADPAIGAEQAELAGSTGYGVVSVVRKAQIGGIPGALVLEPRFIVTSDGAHVPIVLAKSDETLFEGKSGDVKGALNWIPYVSIGTRSYNALHKGADVAVPSTDKLRIAIGDDAVTGACQVLGEERMQASR